MRVYQFAKKIGATCATVMKWAEECEIEVYSPLSELEGDDANTLNARFLKEGPATVKAETEAVRARGKAKAEKAVKARAAKDKAQAEALEAARRRAMAVHNGEPFVMTPAEPPKAEEVHAEKPAKEQTEPVEEKGPKVEIGVSLPELPKVSFEMSEEQDTSGGDDFEDEDDEDALDYLQGKDRGRSSKKDVKKEKDSKKDEEKGGSRRDRERGERDRKDAPAKKDRDVRATARTAEPAAARRSAAPAAPAAPAAKHPAAPQRPASTRVGGHRAGFSSVSMKLSRPQVQIGTAKPVVTAVGAPTAAPAAPAKPTISLSVSTREISIRGAVVVKELALKLGIRPNRLIADLMGLKILASINQRVEPEVAIKVAQKYGYKVNVEHARDAANKKPVLKSIDADDEIPQDKPEDMQPRPPVVTFLGHVDHGKTTLMDYIRHAHVAAGEAGGITQQISAYQVDVQGRKITFLDTPGHAAFNAMRQRGAQLTDIAVIIIAADDGIMPQTEEAIKFARQAGVQIMVAITKCDKPTANTQRVKQQLQKAGLTPEEWGGDIVCCEVSGVSGQGVDNLLEMMLLQADVLELSANPRRRANGYVIEAELEQGFGPSATLLVTGGTLKVGDAILIGEHFGKVRSLIDDRGRRIKEAPPATPVKCTGLSGVPEAGAEFRVMLDEKRARTLAEETARLRKEQELSQTKALSLDDLMSQMNAGDKRELSVVVKSDTQGSLEAIVEALRGIKSEKVGLKIIGTGTGNVSITDVKSAAAGKAVIVGFDIGCDSGVQQQARHDGVRINSFRIIYELIDHVKKTMLDLLPPEYTEKIKGHAQVKAIYDIGKLGKIAGSQMLDGSLVASARYRILRNGAKVWEGKVQTLRHFKDEVKEVTGQQECGICFANYEGFAEGDVVECYILEELPRSL
ncbi:MAG: translation initiation factor IF-2 [Kiritimatiellae bacterium]|nr:translation initiation factor IF-2 [Kiritimatiellia bacterium]